MASLREYFTKDGETNLTSHETWNIGDNDGRQLGEVIARLHYDFEARASYVSFFIPDMPDVECPEAIVLRDISKILAWPTQTLQVEIGLGAERTKGSELVFTGQVYLYSERPVPDHHQRRLHAEATAAGHRLTFRSDEYVKDRDVWQKPRAFISHDSRDKTEIAEPLALQLTRLMLPVWYDQYSLRVGDSLRGSIEAGLKECERCIFLLTPHFLANGGWSKREYDSIFTRELVEDRRLILPVWHNVTPREVFEYSPMLADRVALKWSDGVESVAGQLYGAIVRAT